jgi:hypothetical protein
MAASRRNRRSSELVHGRHDRLGGARVHARPGCSTCDFVTRDSWRRESRPRATWRSLSTHELSCVWLVTDASEAKQNRLDDARSATDLDPLVATIGLVAIGGFVRPLGACLRYSAERRLRCARGRPCRSRYLDPALRRPSLIGQRQAFLPYHTAWEAGDHQTASTALPIWLLRRK